MHQGFVGEGIKPIKIGIKRKRRKRKGKRKGKGKGKRKREKKERVKGFPCKSQGYLFFLNLILV